MADTFCGWYFRCQSETDTVALIPAVHTAGGKRSGSLQIISDAGAWMIPFPGEKARVDRKRPYAVLGYNDFCERGIFLNECRAGISVKCDLRFGDLSPLHYDIMGPFCCVPFMECRHSVASMRHTVSGSLRLNDTEYRFQNGAGYLEGDRGCSFPQRYAWTQCLFESGSLMLSVADIPLGRLHFTGIIGVIQLNGHEYRLATYLGARVEKIQDGEIVVRQGRMTLTATLLEGSAYTLKAPQTGAMARNIRESVTCTVRYRFNIGQRTVMFMETTKAAFEFEYP